MADFCHFVFFLSQLSNQYHAFIGSLFFFQNRASVLFITVFAVGAAGLLLPRLVAAIGNRTTGRIGNFFAELRSSLACLTLAQAIQYLIIRAGVLVLGAINLIVISYFFSYKISFVAALVAANTAFFIGAISMIPMGIGTREATMLFYLDFFGMPPETAIAIITIQRLISTGLTFVIGSALLSVLGMVKIKQQSGNQDGGAA